MFAHKKAVFVWVNTIIFLEKSTLARQPSPSAYADATYREPRAREPNTRRTVIYSRIMRAASMTTTTTTHRPTTSLSVQRRRERSKARALRRASTTRATGDDGENAAGDVRDYFFHHRFHRRETRKTRRGRDGRRVMIGVMMTCMTD